MTIDRGLLPATFGPWFSRFHSLTPVQEQAIPLVLEGRDVLLCSPTASGKTEAYAAPAAELVLSSGSESATVLIVSPTRALANDLKRRLEGPMSRVHVSFGRHTGEHKEKSGGRMPSIVVCTPEALDSLLARRPEALERTRMVVLDEIHVLDNSARGDQLRVLLHRLERVADQRPQRVAASATVDRPAELAARYLEDARIVVVEGARKILGTAFDGHTPGAIAQHLEALGQHGFRKILVFCRSRNQVEKYSTGLAGKTSFQDAIFAHHGSLAKSVRERTERLFLQAPAAVCFATLTLEMGIDIGTVDYVLLAGLPSDVSSLLQRIGRGGRRGDATRCGYVVRSAAQDHVFKTMFRLARDGRLCSGAYGFRPAVLVQQAFVLAASQTYIETADFEACVPDAVREELGDGACRDILESLVEKERMERIGSDRYVVAESIDERYRRGSLHSNIDEPPSMEVVDRLTGDIIARVGGVDAQDIGIGGRNRRVVKISDGRVLTDSGGGSEAVRFSSAASAGISLELGRAVVEGLGVEPNRLGLITTAGTIWLLHGLGTVGALLLADLIGGESVGASSPYTLRLARRIRSVPRPSEQDVERFLGRHVGALAKLCSPGPWNSAIPEALRAQSTRRITELDRIAEFLRTATLQELSEEHGPNPAVLAQL